MSKGYDHLPKELNVPVECTSCGNLFQLFGPDDLSDMCDCADPTFKIYVSDAGKYAGFLEKFIDLAPEMLPGQEAGE